jgi:hypothetical protein
VPENRAVRRIFVPNGYEETADRRNLHNEELQNVQSSPSVIRMMRSRRMRWARYSLEEGEVECIQDF